MEYETLRIEVKEKVAYITLNRPERLNAFDLELGRELHQALHDIHDDNGVRAVLLKGTGKGFCGGGDVKEMYSARDKPRFLRELTQVIHQCVLEIRTMEKPVIAAVNGAAYGAGLSLALACDMIIAVEGAKMNTAFIGIGLTPGCGTKFVVSLVGYHRACELVLTAKTFTAAQAKEWGIVNKVVAREKLDEEAEGLVNKFRTLPPIAVGMAKTLLNESMNNDMRTHLELESRSASKSAGTRDFEEGVATFVEKRKADFKGE